MTRAHIFTVAAAVSAALLFSSCASRGQRTSKNLQAHIGQAQTSSQVTARHISDFKSSVETVDYKSSRALKLWKQGVTQ